MAISSRDIDYIENRLMVPTALLEAQGRLRQIGRHDLAERVGKANKVLYATLRDIRMDFRINRSAPVR